jgi:hypothetical protein
MNIRIVILTIALLLPSHLRAHDKTDVLVMSNGDRMTCEIKELDAGALYVNFDYIDGTVSVDWSKVARVESKQLFIVKTQDGSLYTGELRTPETAAGRPVKIQVVGAAEQETVIDRSRIVMITATSNNFWQRFSGEIDLGMSFSKGNQSTQFNLGSQAIYMRERWSAEAAFNSNLSSSTGATTSTRNSLDLSALRLLRWNNWFYSGFANFLQSSEQGITLRNTFGGGVGRYLKKTNHASVSLLGGAAWQNTHYEQSIFSQSSQNILVGYIGADARLFQFNKTSFVANAALLPALTDPGHVLFDTKASYYVKIFSNLKWNISFYGNWDNRPPPGFSGSDYGTSSGVSWTFGLK